MSNVGRSGGAEASLFSASQLGRSDAGRRAAPRTVSAVKWLLIASLLLMATSHETHAQERAASTGRWLPRQVRFTNMTAAQRAEATAVIDEFERILKQIPEVANPVGYEILPVLVGGARKHGTDHRDLPGSVMEYGLGPMHFRPTRAIAGEGTSCYVVTVNGRQSGKLYDADGRPLYIDDNRARPSTDPNISDFRVPQNATQVYGALWNVPRERSGATALFVTAGPLPWKPVSREEFYRANLFELEGANGEKQAAYRAGLQKTAYEQFLEGAAQRRADREKAVAQMKGILPDSQIAKFRQTQEATERELGEKLKQQDAKDREQYRDAFANSFGGRDSMNAELARMTPAERSMPAYINNALDHGPMATGWRMTADSTPPAWRVLTPSFEFYRARRSPLEVRSIHVNMIMSFTCNAPDIRHAVWQAYHKLDWSAFNNLLEQPR